MFERFSHFLSYGATDQLTVRELVDSFDGLVVPGTVAAFQREGTGGFVLTLSATAARPQYVIDSRFPLFQRRLPNPKRAHRALAELLGVPALVSEAKEPDPAQFSDQMIARIAENWVSFNQGYSTNTIGKFDKYAKRLQEAVELPDVQQPAYVLPPYLVAAGMTDPWWEVSRRLFLACVALDPGPPCVPVAAATDPEALQSIVGNLVDTDRLVVWVSNLHELETDANTLRLYAETLSYAEERGIRPFALYGGFFSVLLSASGLMGSSHGIGYGEYRAWPELPQSGPPPARYYLPVVHRYVSQELAYQLWLGNRELVECYCRECDGQPPIALEYHSLMKHSVLCRATEIADWSGLARPQMVERLAAERTSFVNALPLMGLPGFAQQQGERAADHLPRWIAALR